MLRRFAALLFLSLPVLVLTSVSLASDEETSLTLPGLESPVRVVTDAHGVRHIFAGNDLDSALDKSVGAWPKCSGRT